MATSEAQKRASMKYRAKNKEQMNIDLPIGKKEQYKAQAAKRGLSLSAYIVGLIEADMKQEAPEE
jgi:hypothetical protein